MTWLDDISARVQTLRLALQDAYEVPFLSTLQTRGMLLADIMVTLTSPMPKPAYMVVSNDAGSRKSGLALQRGGPGGVYKVFWQYDPRSGILYDNPSGFKIVELHGHDDGFLQLDFSFFPPLPVPPPPPPTVWDHLLCEGDGS